MESKILDAIKYIRGKHNKRPTENSILLYILKNYTESSKSDYENVFKLLQEECKIENRGTPDQESFFICDNINKNILISQSVLEIDNNNVKPNIMDVSTQTTSESVQTKNICTQVSSPVLKQDFNLQKIDYLKDEVNYLREQLREELKSKQSTINELNRYG